MKFSKLLLAAGIIAVGITSCGKDSDCAAADWAGTYSYVGEIGECEDVSTSDLVITSSGDNISIDGTTIKLSGCKYSNSSTVDFLGTKITISEEAKLDGNSIVSVVKTSVSGKTSTCTVEYTRK